LVLFHEFILLNPGIGIYFRKGFKKPTQKSQFSNFSIWN
jgi:hypothetical protein